MKRKERKTERTKWRRTRSANPMEVSVDCTLLPLGKRKSNWFFDSAFLHDRLSRQRMPGSRSRSSRTMKTGLSLTLSRDPRRPGRPAGSCSPSRTAYGLLYRGCVGGFTCSDRHEQTCVYFARSSDTKVERFAWLVPNPFFLLVAWSFNFNGRTIQLFCIQTVLKIRTNYG